MCLFKFVSNPQGLLHSDTLEYFFILSSSYTAHILSLRGPPSKKFFHLNEVTYKAFLKVATHSSVTVAYGWHGNIDATEQQAIHDTNLTTVSICLVCVGDCVPPSVDEGKELL